MGARACSGIPSNRLTALSISAVEMRRGFFEPAGVVHPIDGVRLRSMPDPADPDVGRRSPNWESTPPRPWAPNVGACATGVLGSSAIGVSAPAVSAVGAMDDDGQDMARRQ
jgi:hypothetical protein